MAHAHGHGHHHRHSHGAVDPEIMRSRAGLRAVGLSLLVLGLCAGVQLVIYLISGSVALLADLIHNAGDAATAFPIGMAFLLRSEVGERRAGLAGVAPIFISAFGAGFEAVRPLIHPDPPDHLVALALGGGVDFAGNWLAAQIRSSA